jgi:prevent-host-death family protein
MRYSTQIKPISYVKANAAELISQMRETREPIIITQNGEATAVLQDVASYEATQETLALLRILAMGDDDIAAGRTVPAIEFMESLKSKATKP